MKCLRIIGFMCLMCVVFYSVENYPQDRAYRGTKRLANAQFVSFKDKQKALQWARENPDQFVFNKDVRIGVRAVGAGKK